MVYWNTYCDDRCCNGANTIQMRADSMEGDNEENVYVTWNEGIMLRVVKILPKLEGNRFSYGGIKLELIELIDDNGNGEEYELIGEIVLTFSFSSLVPSGRGTVLVDSAHSPESTSPKSLNTEPYY